MCFSQEAAANTPRLYSVEEWHSLDLLKVTQKSL